MLCKNSLFYFRKIYVLNERTASNNIIIMPWQILKPKLGARDGINAQSKSPTIQKTDETTT